MNERLLGKIVDFNPLNPRNRKTRSHVAKVEIMKIEKIQDVIGETTLTLLTCRRLDNGHPVLAWYSDLFEATS